MDYFLFYKKYLIFYFIFISSFLKFVDKFEFRICEK